MAKQKLDKKKIDRYLGLAYPESISFTDDDDTEKRDNPEQGNTSNPGITNTGNNLARLNRSSDSLNGALGSATLPFPAVTQETNNPATTNFNDYANSNKVIEPVPPFSFSMPDIVSKQAPMLFGNADINKVSRAVLSTPDEGASSTSASSTSTSQRAQASLTPEERLAATLANTNPTPSGFWKRLLVGASQGAARIQPGDDLGTAFGRILGPAVTRAIPAVDSASKYEENKARAIEKYKLEAGTRDAGLKASRVQQDIMNDAAKIKQAEDARRRQVKIDAENAVERLSDNRRAEAKLKLDALEKMSEGDENRAALATELSEKYGVKVGSDYGLEARKPKEKETSETDLRKRAESDVTRELGATTEERARGATANQLDAELKQRMPPDLYQALTDPNASRFKRIDAEKMRADIEKSVLQRNKDYTSSDYERRVASKMQELRGGTSRTKQPTTSSKGKVQSSNTARTTNFRTIKFR
jgi:hypothetical protein